MNRHRSLIVIGAAAILGTVIPAQASFAATLSSAPPKITYGRLAHPQKVVVRTLPTSASPSRPRIKHPSLRASTAGPVLPAQHASTPRRTSAAAGVVAPALNAAAPVPTSATFPAMSLAQQTALPFGADQAVEPPDPQVAAGPASLLEMVNSTGSVWSKSGSLTGSPFDLNAFYNVPATFSFFDSSLTFDTAAGRFFASGMAFDAAGNGKVWVAVSSSSDPSGAWSVYPVSEAFPNLAFDQAIIAVSGDKVTIEWNDWDCSQSPCHPQFNEIHVVQKSDLVAGSQSPRSSTITANYIVPLVPAVELSADLAIHLAGEFAFTPGGVTDVEVTGTPAGNDVSINGNSGTAPPTVIPPPADQPDGATPLDLGDGRILSAFWNNGILWAVATKACTPNGDSTMRACIELFFSGAFASPGFTMTWGIAGASLYDPALSLTPAGNAIVVANESSIHQYPSVVVMQSEAGSISPNPAWKLLTPGQASYDSSGCGGGSFWDNYSGIARDPSDASTIWGVAEYTPAAADSCQWATSISSIKASAPPLISSISPNTGPTAGGTSVTINGSGFSNATAVAFGSVGAATFSVNSDTQVMATTPAHAAGNTTVFVTTPGGVTAGPAAGPCTCPAFNYVAPQPSVTGVSPSSGSAAGGETITITGSGLSFAQSVNFGGTQVSNSDFLSNSDTQIAVPAPSIPSGTFDLTVTTAGGTSPAPVPGDTFTFNTPAGGLPGSWTTYAGTGTAGTSGDGGPATSAQLWQPAGVAMDGSGNVFVADTLSNRIRKIKTDGTIVTVAGNGTSGFSGDGGPATSAELQAPSRVAIDASGNLFISDTSNNRIRKVSAATGIITTIAGSGIGPGYAGDGGPATSAKLSAPWGVAVATDGSVLIADENNNRIRKVDANGIITTIAGNGTAGSTGDGGPATEAEISSPLGLVLGGDGTLHFVGSGNSQVRKVSPDGTIHTIAASLTKDVALGRSGDLESIDFNLPRIDRVAPDGTVTPIAGPTTGGTPGQLPLTSPVGLAADGAGQLFITDGNTLFRAVLPVIPSAPINVNVATGLGSATVSWLMAYDGGSPPLRYTVTPIRNGTPQAPVIVNGGPSNQPPPTSVTLNSLAAGSYTFAVSASNPAGAGPTGMSATVAILTNPGMPTNVQATNGGDGAAVVSWTAPADSGGSPITEYTVTASPGGAQAGTLGKTTTRVPGLVNGQPYTFTVQAINAQGTSAASAPSNTVYPFAGGSFHSLPPLRILDTRDGTGGYPAVPLGQDQTMNVQITGAGGVPSSGVSAVVVNVTVTNMTAPSFLTVYPAGVPRPNASNLNWTPGRPGVPNLVEVAVGKGGQVTVYNFHGSTDVIFDVAGWVGVTSNSTTRDGMYNPVVPFRLLDTRNGTGTGGVIRPLGQAQTLRLQVTGVPGSNVPSSGVSAVVLNATVTGPTAPSFLTLFPSGTAKPTASNVNFVPGQTVPNRVIVKVGSGGQVDIYNFQGNVDVVIDVGGWFTDVNSTVGGSDFVGITPTRVLDTRNGFGPLGSGETATLSFNGPGAPQISAVVLNVTVADPTDPSFLTVYPDGQPLPNASDLNFVRGLVVPNLVVVKLGTNATIDIYNFHGSTDVVVDLVGYYGVNVPAPGTFHVNPPMRVAPRT